MTGHWPPPLPLASSRFLSSCPHFERLYHSGPQAEETRPLFVKTWGTSRYLWVTKSAEIPSKMGDHMKRTGIMQGASLSLLNAPPLFFRSGQPCQERRQDTGRVAASAKAVTSLQLYRPRGRFRLSVAAPSRYPRFQPPAPQTRRASHRPVSQTRRASHRTCGAIIAHLHAALC